MTSNNAKALRALKELGYPIKNIRLAMPVLSGIEHTALAKTVPTSNANISFQLRGKRNTRSVQEKIAKWLNVPVDEFFPKEESVNDQQ